MFERTLIPFFATVMAIAIASSSFVLTDAPFSDGSATEVSLAPWTQATAENPTGSFRFTKNGWENTTRWRINGEEAKVKFIDNIHPLIWTLIVVLVAFGLAILASDEESVRRLWPKSE